MLTRRIVALGCRAMSAIVIVALTFQQQTKRYLLASDALAILGIYVGNAAMLLSLSPG